MSKTPESYKPLENPWHAKASVNGGVPPKPEPLEFEGVDVKLECTVSRDCIDKWREPDATIETIEDAKSAAINVFYAALPNGVHINEIEATEVE